MNEEGLGCSIFHAARSALHTSALIIQHSLALITPHSSLIILHPPLSAKRCTMIVVMKQGATAAEIGAVIAKVQQLGLTAHPIYGDSSTVIAIVGEAITVHPDAFQVLPGVEVVNRIAKPFKLACVLVQEGDTRIACELYRYVRAHPQTPSLFLEKATRWFVDVEPTSFGNEYSMRIVIREADELEDVANRLLNYMGATRI